MTISTVSSEKSVTGTGSTGPINFPYPVHAATEITVSRQASGEDAVDGAYGTDFTVALAVDFSYADVTLGAGFAAAADGATITIQRTLPLTQTLDLDRAQRIPSASVEREFDRSVMRDQQLSRDLEAALARLTAVEADVVTLELPVVATPTGFLTPQECGAVGDGVTDDTTAWQLFLDTLRDNKVAGFVSGGTYKIQAGTLTYQQTSMGNGPVILTAGTPIMQMAGGSAGPGLTIEGANAGYQMVRGGYLGSLLWKDSNPASARHAVALRGVEGMTIDGQRAENIGGYLINIPNALVGGTNPDPYNVAYCRILASRIDGGRGFLLNENGVGLTNCLIEGVSCANYTDHGYVGGGSMNTHRMMGFANGTGSGKYAISNPGSQPGSPSRDIFENVEIDTCQNGIWHARGIDVRFTQIRIYHKYDSGSGLYWPRTAVKLSDGSTNAVWMSEFQITHVTVTGGSKGNLGVFFDGASSNNIFDTIVRQRVRDDAGFGFADSELYANVAATTDGLILYRGTREILRSRYIELFDARITNSPAPNFATSGFATSSSRVVFAVEIKDGMDLFNSSTGVFTVRNTARHRFAVRITGAFPLGERVRVALMYTRSATDSYLTGKKAFSNDGDLFTVDLVWEGENLHEGDTVWVSVEAGSTVAAAANFDFGGENYFVGGRYV